MSHQRPKPLSPSHRSESSKPKPVLGYCTNVHAGTTVAEIKHNLEEHTLDVKRQVSPEAPMGVGLWLPAKAVLEFVPPDRDGEIDVEMILEWREWLEARGLFAYTLNGFPVSDFHQPVVKHRVYAPDWSEDGRLNYTITLAVILHHLLPPGAEGSISTLPIGWAGAVKPGWADNLSKMIRTLADLYDDTGRIIHLDLEPEPGCEIGDTQTLLTFLAVIESHSDIPAEVLRRHLRVCLDVCHNAVMFEKPAMMLRRLRDGGWKVGKVQISSALRVPFKSKDAMAKREMLDFLAQFAEDRYLHQTTIGSRDGSAIKEFHDDLPGALAAHPSCGDEWRVHFHVPIHLERIGPLETTQSHIAELLRAIRPEDDIRHFEVETYAWGVLPESLRERCLADGIAREIKWARGVLDEVSP